MRILFVVQDTGKLYGAERATLDLLRGLRATGDDVRVLLIEEQRLDLEVSGFRSALENAEIPVDRIPVRGRISIGLIRSIRSALRNHRADIVHSTGYKADVHVAFANGWNRICPMVTTVHGWLFRPDLRERFYGWLNRLAFRRFDAVIALTRFYARYLVETGLSASRVHCIPSGFEWGTLSDVPLPDATNAFTIGLAGRLSEEKQIDLFLRAAARVRGDGRNVLYLIAGDGPLRGELERLRDVLGLRDVVSMPGFLVRQEFLARVHAVALTSRIENMPYTLMEAMAAGRPVIATAVGGIPDLIDDGVTGLMVEPDSVEAIAEAMTRLADDKALFDRLASAASHRLRNDFSLTAQIAAHHSLYEKIRSPHPSA